MFYKSFFNSKLCCMNETYLVKVAIMKPPIKVFEIIFIQSFWLYSLEWNASLHHRCVPLDRQRVLCVPLFHINKTHFKRKFYFSIHFTFMLCTRYVCFQCVFCLTMIRRYVVKTKRKCKQYDVTNGRSWKQYSFIKYVYGGVNVNWKNVFAEYADRITK